MYTHMHTYYIDDMTLYRIVSYYMINDMIMITIIINNIIIVSIIITEAVSRRKAGARGAGRAVPITIRRL